MADFDGDGILDLYTGSFNGGIYLLPGKGKGEFGAPGKVLDKSDDVLRLGQFWNDDSNSWKGSKTSNVPKEHGVSVAAVDWDGDGDLDLVLGASSGKFYLRRNVGKAKAASFGMKSEPIVGDGKPLQVEGGHAMPVATDWDGDGAWDLLSAGDKGSVQWWRNVGDPKEPKFGKPVELVPVSPKTDDAPGLRAQATTCDFDGDGKLDLLLGDYRMTESKSGEAEHHGYVWFFRRL